MTVWENESNIQEIQSQEEERALLYSYNLQVNNILLPYETTKQLTQLKCVFKEGYSNLHKLQQVFQPIELYKVDSSTHNITLKIVTLLFLSLKRSSVPAVNLHRNIQTRLHVLIICVLELKQTQT